MHSMPIIAEWLLHYQPYTVSRTFLVYVPADSVSDNASWPPLIVRDGELFIFKGRYPDKEKRLLDGALCDVLIAVYRPIRSFQSP